MYLSSSFLKGLLCRYGCAKKDEDVYVSCEVLARKDEGKIYKHIRQIYSPTEWVHFGDNKASDYKTARRNGINAKLKQFSYSQQEQRIVNLGKNTEVSWKYEMLSGELRSLRASTLNKEPHWTLAVGYVLPVLIPYSIWILRQVAAKRYSTIYFLSRDGYILHHIASAMQQKSSLPYVRQMNCRYFFVSRKALLPAYLYIADKKAFLAILDNSTCIGRSIDKLLRLWQTDKETLKEKYGIRFERDIIDTESAQIDFLNKLFDSHFMEDFRSENKSKYEMVVSYFRQEGLLNSNASAMVDVGWVGSTRVMVNTILRHEGAHNIDFLYYGVRDDVFPVTYGDFLSFTGPASAFVHDTTHLVEQYFAASPYPSTIGYYRSEHGIVPLFANDAHFADNAITLSNRLSCEAWLEWSDAFERFSDKELALLATTSADALFHLKDEIDLSPLLDAEPADHLPFVIIFDRLQKWQFLLCGHDIGVFDTACNRLTFGSRLGYITWKMHCLSRLIRNLTFKSEKT